MLGHSFDRFYVVTTFILPILDDLKLSLIEYNEDCKYIRKLDDQNDENIKQNIRDFLLYCAKLRPYMAFYKMQINSHNIKTHHILKNKVDLILLKFYEKQKSKRGIFGALISGFIHLAFLHHQRHNALKKAVKAMSISTDTHRNKLMHLENTLIMHGIYNAETLYKLIKRVCLLHDCQSMYESLFASQASAVYEAYSQMRGACGIQHYAVNSMLYLHMIKEKYLEIYNEFISQLHIYAKAVRISAKGYLPISLITPLRLKEVLTTVKQSLIKTNPDYNIVIKRLHLYYDMKLVTSGIDRKRNLIIQFSYSPILSNH